MQGHVDARGLSCPEPVILTRKALEAGGPVTAVVDNETAVENISRLAQGMGYTVEVEQHGNDYHIHIEKAPPTDQQKFMQGVILVTSQYVGRETMHWEDPDEELYLYHDPDEGYDINHHFH